MKINNQMRFTLGLIILFLAVYLPKLRGSSYPLVLYFLPFALVYACIKDKKELIYLICNKYSLSLAFWLMVIIVYSIFVSLIIGESIDFSIPYNYFIWFILFFPSALLAALNSSHSLMHIDAFKYIAKVSLVQAILILLALLLPEVCNLFSDVLDCGESATLKGWEFRVIGFSGTGGASLSILQAIGASACILLFINSFKKYWIFIFLVIVLSLLPVGRSGLLWVCFFILSYLPIFLFNKAILRNLAVSLVLLLCAFSLFLLCDFKIFIREDLFEFIISWSLEPFLNISNPSNVRAISAIADMWVLPDGFNNYFLGSGRHLVDGVCEVGDPGYLRYFYYFGLIGVVLHYSFFVWLMLVTCKHFHDKPTKIAVILTYMLFFLFELKEPFLAKANVLLFFLFFYSIACSHRKRCIETSNISQSVISHP